MEPRTTAEPHAGVLGFAFIEASKGPEAALDVILISVLRWNFMFGSTWVVRLGTNCDLHPTERRVGTRC